MTSEASKNYILDLCLLPRLTIRDHEMETLASSGILEINYKSPPASHKFHLIY